MSWSVEEGVLVVPRLFVSSVGGVDPEPQRRLAKLKGVGLKARSMLGEVKAGAHGSSSGVTGGSSSSDDDAVETRGLAQACNA